MPRSFRFLSVYIELKGKGFHIMGYDASPDTPITQGTNIQMSIDMKDKQEAKTIFETLGKDGKIHTEFQNTSWGAYYGRLTDVFGIQWMVNAK